MHTGCIQVSEVTHGLLKSDHSFRSTGGVEVKGKVGIGWEGSHAMCVPIQMRSSDGLLICDVDISCPSCQGLMDTYVWDPKEQISAEDTEEGEEEEVSKVDRVGNCLPTTPF
jgi:hypothetical protein